MLKGNLVVGKNQSVVVHAESLHELVKVAESKSQASASRGTLRLRVEVAQCDLPVESLPGSDGNLREHTHT